MPISVEALLGLCKMHCSYFLTVLREHVVIIHHVTAATYELAQYIFLQELDNEGFNIVNHLNPVFFKECFIALCLDARNKPCRNNLKTENGKLVNKHRHTFVKDIKFECPHLTARLIESFFGTYPKGYSFSNKGFQYDTVANTVNYIGTFVEIFRFLNLKEMKTISLFLMRTSIVPGSTTIDKTIFSRSILSVTMSRLRALHKDSLCLDIEFPKIPPMRELLVKLPEEIWSLFCDISCWSFSLDICYKGKKHIRTERIKDKSILQSWKSSGDADNNSSSNDGELASGMPHIICDTVDGIYFIVWDMTAITKRLDPAKLSKAETNGWYTSVEDAERALNHPGSSTLNCKLYVEYLLERRKGCFDLTENYHNTQTLGKSRKYNGSSSTDPSTASSAIFPLLTEIIPTTNLQNIYVQNMGQIWS
ncbi:hypothetical protein BX661DRAFT_215687 [Kickxella alabastrina]|uniref:uncharacterized protein n=1 Tax=Kickxella alabastrina TaxID=61397 RepID=UPI00222115B9|nr:uncharacterized protein BX661DRAFT_215687 [Kickxella alabastrina]KAI7834315.1 hypothetical protein BX661DRAFT_215687 [Kickxella alabastrina]